MSTPAALGIALMSLVLCTTLAGMVTAWIWAAGRFWTGRPLLPDAKIRVVPWGAGSMLLVFLAWLAINLAVSYGYLTWSGGRKAHRQPSVLDQMAMVSVTNAILLLVIPALLRLTSRATLADLGVAGRDLAQQALVGTTGFLLVAPLVYMLNGLAILVWKQNEHPLQEMVKTQPTAAIGCLAFISAVVLAPAAEELFFRGIFQSWLAKLFHRPNFEDVGIREPDFAGDPAPIDVKFVVREIETVTSDDVELPVAAEREGFLTGLEPDTWAEESRNPRSLVEPPVQSPWHGIPAPAPRAYPERGSQASLVITSIVFAAVHLPQWPAPLALFFLSLALGAIYQRTGSLFASFLMHALLNGFSTMILFLAILIGHTAIPKPVPTATCIPIATDVSRADARSEPRFVIGRP